MPEKILVVDDEPLILKTIGRALEKVGYDVTTTANSSEFLKALKEGGADVLVVDLHLGGHDTTALINDALAISPSSKILIVSGSATPRPGLAFLQKPFQISDLRDMIRDLLSEP